MTPVFLAYTRGDDGEPFDPARSFLDRLHWDLTAAGCEVWFDRVSIPRSCPMRGVKRSLPWVSEYKVTVLAT
jgi:hypothetical protein